MDFKDFDWVSKYLDLPYTHDFTYDPMPTGIRDRDLFLLERHDIVEGVQVHLLDRTNKKWINTKIHVCRDLETALHLFCTLQ